MSIGIGSAEPPFPSAICTCHPPSFLGLLFACQEFKMFARTLPTQTERERERKGEMEREVDRKLLKGDQTCQGGERLEIAADFWALEHVSYGSRAGP